MLRTQVEQRVEWAGRLSAVEEDLDDRHPDHVPHVADALSGLAAEARAAAAADPAAAPPELLSAFEVADRAAAEGDAERCGTAVQAALRELRTTNRGASEALGALVDRTRYAVVGGIALGAICLIALATALRGLRELSHWRRRLTLLTQATADGLWEWDVETGAVRYSEGWRRATGETGTTLDAWLGRVHPEDLPGLRLALDAHLAGTTPVFEAEYRLMDSAGGWRWFIARGLAERGPTGSPTQVACWQTDVTERRSVADAAEQGAYLNHVADATGLAVLAFDDAGALVQHNVAAEALAGAWGSPAALWQAVAAAVAPPLSSRCPECGEKQPGGSVVVKLSSAGEVTWSFDVTWTGHAHHLLHGRRVTVVAVADVTERVGAEERERLAHERLLASEGEVRAVLDAVPEMVVVYVGDQILYRNTSALGAFGEATGTPEWLTALRLVAGTGESAPTRLRDGTPATVEVSAPVSLTFLGQRAQLLVAHDVSQRVRMESQLRNAERMVALGGLAAGLAHEINNPLTYVIGNLELAQEGEGDVAGRISRALGGAVRVRQVVAQLRAISHADLPELGPVALGPAMESTLGVAAGVGLPPATVLREIEPGIAAMGNPVWIGQVALNLVTNVLLAMAEQPEETRRLTLRARTVGEQVVLEVRDSGPGVSDAVRDRLFEPFVSTRLSGKGSGLGLYICRELAGRMGGKLELTASGRDGATFTLSLPVAEAAGGTVGAAPARDRRPAPAPRPRGKVLVVDDDPVISEVISRYLRHHDVTEARDGASARAAFVREDWDVVIQDIVLGGTSGIDLWHELSRTHPDLASRVTFMTGGSMTPDVARFLLETQALTLVKPFDFRELAQIVDDRVAQRAAARE